MLQIFNRLDQSRDMPALDDGFVTRLIAEVAQALDEVLSATALGILEFGVGARQVSGRVCLELLRQPAVHHPNGNPEQQHHDREYRQQRLCAETKFQSGPEL